MATNVTDVKGLAGAGDEWKVAVLDIDAYCERIGHPHVSPSIGALHSLHSAHVRGIPFENIDFVLGRLRSLSLEVVIDNLVNRKRGGYCYEHSLLFAAALERLGFSVRRCIARARVDRSGPRTHMMLLVWAEGIAHLVDVGLGAGMLYPVPLREGAVVHQGGWSYRLTRNEMLWSLSRRLGQGRADSWRLLHKFDDQPQNAIDYEIFHYYASAHPKPLVVIRADYDRVHRLGVGALTVEHSSGQVDRVPVAADELDLSLRDLGIQLDTEDLNALRDLWNGPDPLSDLEDNSAGSS